MATNNAVNTSLSGQNGTGTFVGSISPTLVTPNIGVGTATSIQFSPSTSGVFGTTTNNLASAGSVGEVISAQVLNTAPVTITTSGTSQDLTSIILTAGDWDVWGNIRINYASVIANSAIVWINSSSATQPDSSVVSKLINITSSDSAQSIVGQVWKVATTTTLFLSVNLTFTGTATASGKIIARRVR